MTAYWPIAAGAFRKQVANDNQNWDGQHVRAAQALLDDAESDFNDGKYVIAGSAILGAGHERKAVHIVEWQND